MFGYYSITSRLQLVFIILLYNFFLTNCLNPIFMWSFILFYKLRAKEKKNAEIKKKISDHLMQYKSEVNF